MTATELTELHDGDDVDLGPRHDGSDVD